MISVKSNMSKSIITLCLSISISLVAMPILAQSIDTNRSTWIEGSKYENGSVYVDTGSKVYRYDNVSKSDWSAYKGSDSLGRGFNEHIKSKYNYSDKSVGSKDHNDIDY